MARLRVGLIGCGRIAQAVHLGILTTLPTIDLVALAEPDAERRGEAQRRVPTAVAFADYRELLALPAVEAVVICLPHALHAEAAIAALEARKQLYLEKPLATNLAEGQAVLDAWERAGTVGMIGFNYRYHPLHRAARQRLRAEAIGELVGLRAIFASAARPLPPWHQSRQSGGGALLNLGSHHIDLVRFLLEREVGTVFADIRTQRSAQDSAALQLSLGNGVLAQLFLSMSAVEEDRIEIYGQRGKLAFDRHRSLAVEVGGVSPDVAPRQRLGRALRATTLAPRLLRKLAAPTADPSFRAALADFAHAAQRGQLAADAPDLAAGYRSLAIIAAAEESAVTGRAVASADAWTPRSGKAAEEGEEAAGTL